MKLITKLTLGHLIIGLFVIVVAIVGINTINQINVSYNVIARENLPTVEALQDISAANLRIVASTSELALIKSENKFGDNASVDVEKENIESGKKDYDAALLRYEEMISTYFPAETYLLDDIKNKGEKFQNTGDDLVALKEQAVSGPIILEKWEDFEDAERELMLAINRAIAFEDEEILVGERKVSDAIAAATKYILFAGLLAFAIAIVLGARISKSISDPIIKLKSAAVEIGKGKLDTRVDIKSKDEVGILAACFNQMAERLEQGIEERRKAAEVTRESEEIFRLLFENARDAIFWSDPETGLILRCNKAAEKLLEKESREIIGHHQSTLHSPEKAEYYAEQFKRHFQQKWNVDEDAEVITKSGKIKPVQISASVTIVRGKPIMQGIFHDITERKLAENALKESEERYRRLVDFSPYGIIIHSDAKIVLVNQAGAKILGAANPEEIIGIPVLQIIHPDYHKIVKERIHMQEEGKAAPLIEEKFLRLDGTSVDVELAAIPFTYKGKLAMYGVFLDITERKQAEDALRRSERDLKESQRVAQVGSWQWILASDIITWSEGYYRIIGRDLALPPPNYKEHLKMYTEESAARLEAAVSEILKNGTPYEINLELLHPDGSRRFMIARGEAVRETSGQVVMLRGTLQDVTERKNMEELRLENERLVYANQAKSDFLAVMSHELRTPLNAVIGFSELLKQEKTGELNEKQEHYVDNVLTGGKHLLDLVTNILELASLKTEKIDLAIEKISVPDAINEASAFIKENAAKRNVILKINLDPQLDVIDVDRTKFKQILLNLLDNAVKFSKPEGGTVTITTKKSEDMAKISVSDTGIGIKEKDIGKLFTMFQQVDSGISRNHGGAGLGLAISRQFVELHGGKIMVESKYGEGSTFTFLIPLVAKKGGENK